jgi:tRNA-2-methylthio-N6-dimethylallyladenosine synthase
MLVQLESGNRRVTGLSFDNAEAFDTPFTRRDNPHRAYLTIIEGCDKSCAYCVVPFTRGPERSRTSQSVMAEAGGLAEKGYTEVQLLGQNVNSYRDPSPPGWDARSLGRVAEIPGMRRVRYTTHPRDFVRAIVDAMDANPSSAITSICPCSQAPHGLAAMDRLYTRDEYMRRIEWIKNAKRRYSLTTDIIIGFPGETDHDFQQTLDLLDEVQYDSLFSFKYSPRPNTAAPQMEDRLPEDEKQRRADAAGKQRAIQIRRNAGSSAAFRKCWWAESRAGPVDQPHLVQPDSTFRTLIPGTDLPATSPSALPAGPNSLVVRSAYMV